MNAIGFVPGVLTVVGSLFVLLAGIGVVRLPDLYTRMHAATKAPALGVVLIALAAEFSLDDGIGKLLLTTGFVLVTTPAASHFVGRIGYRADGVPRRIDGPDEFSRRSDGDIT